MRRFALKIDPMATDPGRWGHSLGNLAELVIPCLGAAAPESVLEVGAYAGDVTRLLVDWAGEAQVRIWLVPAFFGLGVPTSDSERSAPPGQKQVPVTNSAEPLPTVSAGGSGASRLACS